MTTIYSAKIEQASTGDPTENAVLEWLFPQLGIEYTYINTGQYNGRIKDNSSGNSVDILNSTLPNWKVWLPGGGYYIVGIVDGHTFHIFTCDNSGTPADDLLQKDLVQLFAIT